MKLATLSLALAAVVFSGCARDSAQRAVVTDVTQSETLILRKAPGEGPVQAISVEGSGAIVGSAEVQLMLNGTVYQRAQISGSIRFRFGGDWYTDTAEIRYVPASVSSGNVTLTYELRGI